MAGLKILAACSKYGLKPKEVLNDPPKILRELKLDEADDTGQEDLDGDSID
jgi:hypothetical protein